MILAIIPDTRKICVFLHVFLEKIRKKQLRMSLINKKPKNTTTCTG